MGPRAGEVDDERAGLPRRALLVVAANLLREGVDLVLRDEERLLLLAVLVGGDDVAHAVLLGRLVGPVLALHDPLQEGEDAAMRAEDHRAGVEGEAGGHLSSVRLLRVGDG